MRKDVTTYLKSLTNLVYSMLNKGNLGYFVSISIGLNTIILGADFRRFRIKIQKPETPKTKIANHLKLSV